MAEAGEEPGGETFDTTSDRLAPFLELHDKSSLVAADEPGWGAIKKPWNDESVEINVNFADQKLATALNAILLPERYSAIYHREAKSLEVIYTVFPPKGERVDIATRSFVFRHLGNEHECCFEASSDELLTIAKHITPTGGPAASNHRNLLQYNIYASIRDKSIKEPAELLDTYKDANAISFWIKNLEWDEENVYDLILHLNFFMFYYDRETPLILIHTPAAESRLANRVTRFCNGKFPEKIQCVEINHDLLHFWIASTAGDPARRFLHSYQIIEYAAFYMVEDDIANAVRKLLSAPDALSRSFEVAAQIVEAFGETKLTDPQKIELVIRKFVDPKVVWDVIEASKDTFTKAITFEGGYVAQPFCKDAWKLDDFKTNWPSHFAASMRNMRNALSHGREQRMTAVITPTAHNMRLLQPWVPLVAASAREIMIFRTAL